MKTKTMTLHDANGGIIIVNESDKERYLGLGFTSKLAKKLPDSADNEKSKKEKE